MEEIYLDYNASCPSPLFQGEQEFLALWRNTTGNPSSLHKSGRRARRQINESTESVARHLGCLHHEIYWTSGASEGNSWVVHSAIDFARHKNPQRKPRLIISEIEHDSLLLAAQNQAARNYATVDRVRVGPSGVVDLDHLAALLDEPCDLVSIMAANNETGVLQPLAQIGALCQTAGAPLHCDAVQTLGREKIEFEKYGVTYATFSGHKIGAPKGVGFLAIFQEGRLLNPIVWGKQQKGLRGGTENALGVALVGQVIKALDQGTVAPPPQLREWHRSFEAELKQLIPGAVIHGEMAPRLSNTTFVGFEGADDDGILMNLDLEGIFSSSGSACSSGSTDPSYVLLAMGQDASVARSSVRFSSGYYTQQKDFSRVLEVLPSIVERNCRAYQKEYKKEHQ